MIDKETKREARKKFCERFKMLRLRKGWSQAKLAEKMNVSTSTIASWEKGYTPINLTAFLNLAIIFEVSCDFLAGLSDSEAYIPRKKDLS